MKTALIPFLVLLFPSIVLYLLFSKSKLEIFRNKWLILVFGIIFLLINLFLIVVSVEISAEGTIEKGIKCATGSIVFIPIGFIFSLLIIPAITVKKFLQLKNE